MVIVERNHVNQNKAQSVNFFSTQLFAVGYSGDLQHKGKVNANT